MQGEGRISQAKGQSEIKGDIYAVVAYRGYYFDEYQELLQEQLLFFIFGS